MTGYLCPIEGCDYGEQDDKTLGSVRAHVNAATDHPKWSAVSDQVEQPAESGRDSEQSDELEAPVEQREAAESSASEQVTEAGKSAGSEATTDDDHDDEMPTDDEYQQQQEGEQPVEQTEADENDGSDDLGTADSTAEQAAAATGAVGYLTGINPLVVVALAVGVLLFISLATAESGPTSQKQQTAGDSEAESSSDEQAIEQTGGLS